MTVFEVGLFHKSNVSLEFRRTGNRQWRNSIYLSFWGCSLVSFIVFWILECINGLNILVIYAKFRHAVNLVNFCPYFHW